MNIIKSWFAQRAAQRKAKKFEEAVKLVESTGLTVCEIVTIAGTDYIRASDGSWNRIGGKK